MDSDGLKKHFKSNIRNRSAGSCSPQEPSTPQQLRTVPIEPYQSTRVYAVIPTRKYTKVEPKYLIRALHVEVDAATAVHDLALLKNVFTTQRAGVPRRGPK